MLDVPSDLVEAVRQASRAGLRGTWLRGRCFPRGARPSSRDFLPAHREGRFHRRGEEALYFGRTLDAVRHECGEEDGRPCLWVQRFDLDLPLARVLAPPLESPLLRGVWAAADERASAAEDYALTHVLADAARRAGVEAILFPSDESPEGGLVNLALLGGAARAAARMAVGPAHRV